MSTWNLGEIFVKSVHFLKNKTFQHVEPIVGWICALSLLDAEVDEATS